MSEIKNAVESGKYDVIWTSPSQNSAGAMPCGGHSLGATVWVEDGSIRFYIDRSGSFDENNLMLKLGRFVVQLDPNPFSAESEIFEQKLDLHSGQILISGSTPDGTTAHVKIWCSTENPTLFLSVSSNKPIRAIAGYQSWRTQDRIVPENQRRSCFSVLGQPNDIVTRSDELSQTEEGVLFLHQNENEENSFLQTARHQGLADFIPELWNPQHNHIFGGIFGGEGFVPVGSREGEYAGVPYFELLQESAPAREHLLYVVAHSDRTADLGKFKADVAALARLAQTTAEIQETETRSYWKAFWDRSWVDIRSDDVDQESQDFQVGRNYALFRYMLGANQLGEYPTKFNGGLFTTDAVYSVPDHEFGVTTPDFRIWGGGTITGQNQRLVHWPMLRSGDIDLLKPQLEFFRKALANSIIRTKHLWGHGGSSFCEQLEESGLPISYEWGWDSPRDHVPGDHYRRESFFDPTELARPWVRYHYSTQLEMSYIALQAYLFTGLDVRPYLPFIDASLTFFDEHYRMRHRSVTGRELSVDGELVISPSTAVETYKDAINPTDAVQGLKHVLQTLLGPARELIDSETAQRYQKILETVPPQPLRRIGDVTLLAPAKSWSDVMNVELPQLYGVFPYPDYGIGRPDLQLARDTYWAPEDAPGQRDHISWHQDGIFAARLGLVDEARRIMRLKLADGLLRFPAFWGPGHDWTPDHNWGGSGMVGVQEMLLQEWGSDLHILPCWPDDLDVDFALHARGDTRVEVSFRSGAVVRFTVTPENRAANIVHHKTLRLVN